MIRPIFLKPMLKVLSSPSNCRYEVTPSFFRRFAQQSFSSTDTSPSKCRKCGKPLPPTTFQCPSCQSIREPQGLNYFSLLQVEETFNVDKKELTTRFRALQSKFHPDKFSQSGEEERLISENISSHLNKAYSTLLDPYKRGKYLLSLKSVSEEEVENVKLDSDFLMQIMGINEQLEEINDASQLDRFEETNNSTIDRLTSEVEKCLNENKLDEAKVILSRMKYYCSIADRIKSIRHDKTS